MLHLIINDHPIEVYEGCTLLEACRENGFPIPTLCYHPALEPYGGCRLCMVELALPPRPPRLVAACVTPCEEGQIVYTDTPAVQQSRRLTAELLLAGAGHQADMRALAHDLGVTEARYTLPEDNDCILCGLCVRACREIVGAAAISLIYRGMAKKVSPPFEISSAACIGCGTCVLICPTGAIQLSDVTGYRSTHSLELEAEQVACRLCEDAVSAPAPIPDIAVLLKNGEGHTSGQEKEIQ